MNLPSGHLLSSLPTRRQLRRSLGRNPYLPGRPVIRDDSRFWSGLALGVGVGTVAAALLSPRSGAELRAGLRAGASRLRARLPHLDGREHRLVGGGIEESIEIDVPVEKAYEQWVRFEEFPKFMKGVLEVRRDSLSPDKLHWRAQVAGVEREWEAEIVEQAPNQRVAWRSIEGTRNAGVVTFHHLEDGRCKLMLQLDQESESPLEAAGDATGLLRRRVRGDLKRFRDFVEGRAGH